MIKLTKQWDSQPQEAVAINPDHPLAGVVVGFWVASNTNALAVPGSSALLASNGVTREPSQVGIGVRFGAYASSSIISLPNTSVQRMESVDGSMLVGATASTISSGGEYHHMWAVRDASTQVGAFVLGNDATSYVGGCVGFSCAGVDSIGSSGSAKQNQYAVYGAQWGASGRRLYVNGALDATSANTGRIAASAIQPSLGNRQSGGRAFGGAIHWWAAFNANIGDEWHARLAADPWQLIEPRRIWVPVSTTSSGNYTVTADSGTYLVTGQAATLLRNKVVSADHGTYSVSGQTTSIYRNKVLSASHGTYSVSGQNASLFKTRIVTAEFGSYSVTGQNATISYTPTGGYTLVAEKGDYTYTGQTATLLRSKVVNALNGTYSVTGQNATLSYSGSNTITLKAGSWLRYRIIQ